MTDTIQEAWKFGSARCEGCGDTVDLSDAATISEAKHKWNKHVRTVHANT